jgi:ABC-2 type transport system permease protein
MTLDEGYLARATEEGVRTLVYLMAAVKSYNRNRQYLMAHMAKNVGSVIFGFLYISLWLALFREPGAATSGIAELGYNPSLMVRYLSLAQCVLWTTYFTPAGLEIGRLIRTGDISTVLSRPVDFFAYTLSQQAGNLACNCVNRSLPMLLMFTLTVGFPWPASAGAALAFVPAVLLGAYVTLCLVYLVGATGFWTRDISWANRLYLGISYTFIGVVLPVEMFPGWLGRLAVWLPFTVPVYYPVRIYLGLAPTSALLIGLGWAAVLTICCLVVTARGRRRLEVQGG